MIFPEHPIFKQIHQSLKESIQNLEGSARDQDIHEITSLIVQSMSFEFRRFHTIKHILDIAGETKNPIHLIAAYFHDLVYVQVDGKIQSLAWNKLSPFVSVDGTKIKLLQNLKPDENKILAINLNLFPVPASGELNPFDGQNEFLSSMVMGLVLEKFIKIEDIIKISAYIEATVPFKSKNQEGQNRFEVLKGKLLKVYEKCKIQLTEIQVEELLFECVNFANLDVSNFSDSNIANFLNNTWALIPETNHTLRYPERFTLLELRTALLKMGDFLTFLKGENVFHSYKNYPDQDEVTKLIDYAARNIEVGGKFLGIKLVTLAIMEVICIQGNIPIVDLVGFDVNENMSIIHDYLPKLYIEVDENYFLDPNLINLFDMDFDQPTSSLARFVYLYLGHYQVMGLVDKAKAFFKNTLSKGDFIEVIDPFILAAITYALSRVSKNETKTHYESLLPDFLEKIPNEITQFDFKKFAKQN